MVQRVRQSHACQCQTISNICRYHRDPMFVEALYRLHTLCQSASSCVLVVDLKEGKYVSLCQFQDRMEKFKNVFLCLA
jgi:hypothetical protein